MTFAATALLVALAYSVPHPFSAPGSGGSYATGVNRLAPGRTVKVDIGLSDHLLPTELTGVTLNRTAVVRSVELSDAFGTIPGWRLPAHVGAGGQWLTLHVGLSCPTSSTTISFATLHY